MTEVWKDVVGYEGIYEVSDHGRVKSVSRIKVRKNGSAMQIKNRILKKSVNAHGYEIVSLSNDGKRDTRKIHRLVAEAFCEKKNEKNCVNHKDGNKTNNYFENLEWCTHSENIVHAYEKQLRKNGNITHLTNGNEVYKFCSAIQASLFLGRPKGYVTDMKFKGRTKVFSADGMEYSLKRDEKNENNKI